jgi:hypothetical protein
MTRDASERAADERRAFQFVFTRISSSRAPSRLFSTRSRRERSNARRVSLGVSRVVVASRRGVGF